jgi:hypothetical protein
MARDPGGTHAKGAHQALTRCAVGLLPRHDATAFDERTGRERRVFARIGSGTGQVVLRCALDRFKCINVSTDSFSVFPPNT